MSGHRAILVVEDDAEIRRLIAAALEDAGHRTAQAVDGPSAIAYLEAEEPLALVLDIGLPYVDGTEVARAARRLHDGNVPIVVVSANGHCEADAREIGASGFLCKPFDVEELTRVVRRAVAGREALSAGQREANDRRAIERDATRERRGVLQRDVDAGGR